ncbi:MAG: DUF2855 family protein [Pseudomonadota bacterium]
MTDITVLEVQRTALDKTRLASRDSAIKAGEVLVAVERYAMTANNVTYGVVGEKIGYWQFFPAEEGWGIIPVWGVGRVVESACEGMEVGERLYGYFPMGTHLVMAPTRIKPNGFADGAAHRAALPPVYNQYARLAADPAYIAAMDNARIVLFPLYATSFCLHDFMVDQDWFGIPRGRAGQVIIPSASSKTAIGLAYALADDPQSPASVGLTSPGNLDAVKALGLYDRVLTYDDLDAIDANLPSVIIDMSGNGKILNSLHKALGDQMRYCCNVGLTHYSDNKMGPDFISDRSAMFFAPGHIQKRNAEWGPGVFQQKALTFWHDAAKRSESWLTLSQAHGTGMMDPVYQAVLSGSAPASEGKVVVLDAG